MIFLNEKVNIFIIEKLENIEVWKRNKNYSQSHPRIVTTIKIFGRFLVAFAMILCMYTHPQMHMYAYMYVYTHTT